LRKIIIIGTGALAAECLETINLMKDISVIGFLDDYGSENYYLNKIKYSYESDFLGTVNDYSFVENENVLVAFSATSKKILFDFLSKKNLNLINLIHPSVSIPRSTFLGFGNIIGQNTVIGPNVRIGCGNIFTAYSFISHDCNVGDFNFFSTAGLAGNVTIGNSNFFGIRSTVIPDRVIGNENTIQAGMIVDRDIKSNSTVFYRYKERIIINNE